MSIRAEMGVHSVSLPTAQRSGEILDLGFLVGIDTDCFRGGWLTALDVASGEVILADQQGQ